MGECKQRNRGRGRGVLALTSFEPCPRPSEATIGSWHKPRLVGKRIDACLPVTNKCETNGTKSSTKDIRYKTSTSNGHFDDANTNNVKNTQDTRVNKGGTRDIRVNNGATQDIRVSNGGTRDIRVSNGDVRDIRANGNTQSNGHAQTNGHAETNAKKEREPDMIAKYNYKANPDKPGGFDELSLKQGEKLILIRKGHQETNNNLWWEVRNENGGQGFVPGKYCHIVEKAPTALPWLENKRLEQEKEERKREAERAARGPSTFGAPTNSTPKIREYQSAYSTNVNVPQARNAAEAAKEYYCEICDKNLNGPQPYKMHMSSKAHREEVEYQKSKDF